MDVREADNCDDQAIFISLLLAGRGTFKGNFEVRGANGRPQPPQLPITGDGIAAAWAQLPLSLFVKQGMKLRWHVQNWNGGNSGAASFILSVAEL